MLKTKMSSSQAYPEGLRCILLDTIANLIPHESGSQGLYLTRLRAALQEFVSLPSPHLSATKPTSYFHNLPLRALENIIRHLSDRPKSTKWEQFIDSRDAQSLYCGEGPLTKVFQRQFPNVEVKDHLKLRKPPPKIYAESPSPPVLKSPPSLRLPLKAFAMPLKTRTWNSGAVEVLTAAGSSITSIAYTGDGGKDPPPHLVSWIDPFTKHCTGVKRLEIRRMNTLLFQTVLEASAGMLQSLYLDSFSNSPSHLFHVSRHCIGLRELSLPIGLPVSASLWKTVGPTLEELHFTLPSKPPPPPMYSAAPPPPPSTPLPSTPTFTMSQRKDVIKSIGDNCRAIRRISVNSVSSDLRSNISSLFRSYGDQLEYAGADFHYISSIECRNIADNCPNAVFDLRGVRTHILRLQDLRFQFHSLRLTNLYVSEDTELDIVGTYCNELRELDIGYQNWQATYNIASLLRLPKLNLVELRLHLSEDNGIEVLRELSMRTSTLRRFIFTLQNLRCDGFKEFFEANSRLEELKLTVSSKATVNCTRVVVQFIEHCVRLQHLRELIMNRWQTSIQRSAEVARIADACIPLRTRRTHVVIFEKNTSIFADVPKYDIKSAVEE